MNEAQLLAQLANVLNSVQIIGADNDSIGDMVMRYEHPPLTRAFPICIRLSRSQHAQITALMQKINEHLATVV